MKKSKVICKTFYNKRNAVNIYVANIAHTVTEEMLRTAFEEFGNVKSVRIIKDRLSGEPRGFAFVEMPDTQEAQAAISNMNERKIEGKQLRVNEARERDESAPRPSRFSRDGGNRNGFGNNSGPRRRF
ncbi:RNA recognition motif domain-containing protein [Candidatus Babela massiliensis]|nr:hypothetical protein [Candidatus Babela massiliensis]